ncbi:hypothetical protein Q8G50_34035, partial [Klebsiella pneumoniae]
MLTFVEDGHRTMDPLLKKTQVEFPIGLESPSLQDYCINAIPHAFVVNKTGKITWQGNPEGS